MMRMPPRAQAARSIAPPTSGPRFGTPMSQLARSPFAATSNAPRIVTSIWPPRIIANAPEEATLEAPGRSVMRRLPASTRPDADHAVLRLEGHVHLRRQIVRAMHRQADAEVHHLAIGDVLRGAPGDLQAIERAHDKATKR